YQGCLDAGHKAAGGAPKYGYRRDLNHNLVSIKFIDNDGSEVEYLHNDYGTKGAQNIKSIDPLQKIDTVGDP
ncbi:MAG: hypothetical protein ACREUO_04930, partial [Burkholderiales bacterium]